MPELSFPLLHSFNQISSLPSSMNWKSVMIQKTKMRNKTALTLLCCDSNSASLPSIKISSSSPHVLKKRKRYRREYPGESKGITEELRFVAMRLRNINGKKLSNESVDSSTEDEVDEKDNEDLVLNDDDDDDDNVDSEIWQPSLEGFLKYLVDSKLVFNTVEQIVDESSDVAYSYFRKTGLERSDCLAKDLEWFSEQGILIPKPSNPGVQYAEYLEELAEKSAPLFLCHYYNIYFSHIAGGQVIARKVSERILEGKELEFYMWAGDAQEMLKSVREKLNMLGEHWPRDDKNKCLREATKAFRYLGQIVRLIIL